jgi:hypothetical protein
MADCHDLSSRLILCDRLLTVRPADLAILGLPVPLPSAGTLLMQTIAHLEVQAGLTREG